MPITSTTLKSSIRSNILARWPWDVTEASKQLIDAYAAGLGAAFYNTLSGLTFAAGTVTGGTAPPSGPVVGAVLSYSPGSISGPALDLASVFVPPQFKIIADGTGDLVTGSYTPWLKCFTEKLSNVCKTAWGTYITTWAMAGSPVAGGGTANWVASTPPVPGPWVAGTITIPFVFASAGTGIGGYVWTSLQSDFVSIGKITAVTIPIQASDPITTNLIATDQAASIASAIAGGFADTVASTIASVTVYDPSGSGGSGIAAPGGVVTGTLTGAKLNLSA